MSTRASVLIKDGRRRTYLYHHFDGYPDGVGAKLKNYFSKLVAQWETYYIVNDLVKKDDFEWTYSLHEDIDYIYVVDCKIKKIFCYHRPGCSTPVTNNFEEEFVRVLF